MLIISVFTNCPKSWLIPWKCSGQEWFWEKLSLATQSGRDGGTAWLSRFCVNHKTRIWRQCRSSYVAPWKQFKFLLIFFPPWYGCVFHVNACDSFLVLMLKFKYFTFLPPHPVYYSLDENLNCAAIWTSCYFNSWDIFVEIFWWFLCVWKIKYLRWIKFGQQFLEIQFYVHNV